MDAAARAGPGPRGLLRRPPRLPPRLGARARVASPCSPSSSSARPTRPRASRSRGSFSPSVSLAVSIDLKNAQRQTWVVDVHGLRRLPPLAAQVFTDDYGRFGGTLQQRIELGGSAGERRGGRRPAPRRDAEDHAAARHPAARLPRLRSRAEARRSRDARRPLRRRDRRRGVPAGRGWPEAQVTLRDRPVRRRRGGSTSRRPRPRPARRGRLRGRSPARRLAPRRRRTSTGPGSLEPGALEEMRLEALRALRALGHLAPEVGGRRPKATRQSVASSSRRAPGGRSRSARSPSKASPRGRRASSPGASPRPSRGPSWPPRLPSADRRLLEALLGLGYPTGRILERGALEEGGRLTVASTPAFRPSSPPSRSAACRPTRPSGSRASSRLSPGEPADADRTAALGPRDGGRPSRAAVSPRRASGPSLSPATPEDPPRLAVVFDVGSGTAERLGSVTFEGLSRTSPALARRVAALSPGEHVPARGHRPGTRSALLSRPLPEREGRDGPRSRRPRRRRPRRRRSSPRSRSPTA